MSDIFFVFTQSSVFLTDAERNRPLIVYHFVFILGVKQMASMYIPTSDQFVRFVVPDLEAKSVCWADG